MNTNQAIAERIYDDLFKLAMHVGKEPGTLTSSTLVFLADAMLSLAYARAILIENCL